MYSTCLKFVDYLSDHNWHCLKDDIYNQILRLKACHNFVVKKRFLVSKEIVNRYLVPLPTVIALFTFILPEAYLRKLKDNFEINDNEIGLKLIKRIKIYQYIDANQATSTP